MTDLDGIIIDCPTCERADPSEGSCPKPDRCPYQDVPPDPEGVAAIEAQLREMRRDR